VPAVRARRSQIAFRDPAGVPTAYKGTLLDASYRLDLLDLLVEDTVVIEVKSVERLLLVHDAQVLTYLRLTRCPVGLLINFNVPKLVDGVRRIINPDLRSLRSSVPPL
jgi:GxxExxY protein